ncbi:hypothetical protein [Cyanobium sp. NS01]|uniref:hypothetical protein n=1 Tax=Cyanobium sp. NS01 TaxID=261284 RepID=UPI0016440C26|nr:hypothetical protein [Cyanobium sp. NS01]QNI70354.1 hypothetical protein CyaNS01_01218 [Cyanobium sp. NS01]
METVALAKMEDLEALVVEARVAEEEVQEVQEATPFLLLSPLEVLEVTVAEEVGVAMVVRAEMVEMAEMVGTAGTGSFSKAVASNSATSQTESSAEAD